MKLNAERHSKWAIAVNVFYNIDNKSFIFLYLPHVIEETCKREFISLDVKEAKLQRATHHKFEFLRQQIMHGYEKQAR